MVHQLFCQVHFKESSVTQNWGTTTYTSTSHNGLVYRNLLCGGVHMNMHYAQ